MEFTKFDHRKEPYYKGLEMIKGLGYEIDDFVHHFPCFVGHMTISRFLVLYEAYKMTLGISGHVADVGIFRGASLLWLTKLTQIFDPESMTQEHGFDWFQGMDPGQGVSAAVQKHAYMEPYDRLMKLIHAQSLENVVRVHRLDVTSDLKGRLEQWPQLQFKLFFWMPEPISEARVQK